MRRHHPRAKSLHFKGPGLSQDWSPHIGVVFSKVQKSICLIHSWGIIESLLFSVLGAEDVMVNEILSQTSRIPQTSEGQG